jgi:antitoxin (DNA-binding transcriptional repressor) of toxin-antitoxin stability system
MRCYQWRPASVAVLALVVSTATARTAWSQPTLDVVHSFDGINGSFPQVGVVQGGDGDLYGIAPGAFPPATVFKLASDGTFSIVAKVSSPTGRLYLTANGTLYGASAPNIFTIDAAGQFASFKPTLGCGGVLGIPTAFLATNDGNIFGTTRGPGLTLCGSSWLQGAIYRLAPSAEMNRTRFIGSREIAIEIVGIRELKTHLSRHLRRVRSGTRLLVTERGRSIATINPVEAPADVDWAHQFVSEGHAQWRGGKPTGATRPATIKGKTASSIALDDRR